MSASIRPGILLALGLTLAAGCYAPRAKRVEVRSSWSSADINQVVVRGTNGRIRVEASEVPEIRMVATIRTRSGQEKKTDEYVVTSVEGDTLTIREKRSGRSVRIFPFSFGDRRPDIDFEIQVPRRVDLSARTVNGRVEIDGVAGEIDMKSVNGRLTVTAAGGELTATTVNGAIRAAFTDFQGARLKSVNGSIAIEVPSEASLDLDIHQVNGNFQTDLPVIVDSSSRHATHGSLHGGKYPLEVNTVNGSVRLRQSAIAPRPLVPELVPADEAGV